MSDFNPLKVQSLAEFKEGKSLDVFRTKDGTKLYIAPKGRPDVTLVMFSPKIQSKADVTSETVVGTFLNKHGEEMLTAYNPSNGKEAEFSL